MIEKAMHEAGYSVKQNKNAKSQVSECIKILQTESTLPIQKARMRVKVSVPVEDWERLKDKILEGAEKVEVDEKSQIEWEVVRRIDCSFISVSSHHSASDDTHRPRPVSRHQRIPAKRMQRSGTFRDSDVHSDSWHVINDFSLPSGFRP
jgi:hypothetical protein